MNQVKTELITILIDAFRLVITSQVELRIYHRQKIALDGDDFGLNARYTTVTAWAPLEGKSNRYSSLN